MKKIEIKDILFSSSADGESEFFPLLSDEDEQKIDKEKNPKELPILPLRNTVLFRQSMFLLGKPKQMTN